MDNNSKYNLYRFIEKLQYHGDIQKINNTTGIYEKVALKDVDLKLPCGAYISSMILLILSSTYKCNFLGADNKQ